MNLEVTTLRELSHHRRTDTALLHLYEAAERIKIVETVERWFPEAEGNGKWGVVVPQI